MFVSSFFSFTNGAMPIGAKFVTVECNDTFVLLTVNMYTIGVYP